MTAAVAVETASSLLVPEPPACPYPGLRPFERQEWPIFFGRERMTDEVIALLLDRRLVVVHGTSGCGKSSLVRAGVQAHLEQLHARSGIRWLSAAARPGWRPLDNLAEAILELDAAGAADRLACRRALNQGALAPRRVAELLALGERDRACLLIDQFEELFRFSAEVSRDEAALFIDFLTAFLSNPPSGIYILLTMRSEFLGECAYFPGLAEMVNATQYLLPRMTTDDLLRAVTEPATMRGGRVTGALAERLVADARGGQDELPLIQHGLARLWHVATEGLEPAASGPVLDLPLYDEKGPLSRLLDEHADAVASDVAGGGDGGRIVEELFRALTDINAEGAAIRRPRRFGDLVAVTGTTPERLRVIVDGFRADGVSFLTPYAPDPIGDGITIDISHEALIRCWHEIAREPDGWLHREFEDGLIWRSLRTHARVWRGDPGSVLSAATTERWGGWFEGRNPAWSERHGGEWGEVEALLEASRRKAALDREAREQAVRNEERARAAEEKAEAAERLMAEQRLRAEAAQALAHSRAWQVKVVTIAGVLLLFLSFATAYQYWVASQAELAARLAHMEALRSADRADREALEATQNLQLAQRLESLRLAALSNEMRRAGELQLATLLALQAMASDAAPFEQAVALAALRGSLSLPHSRVWRRHRAPVYSAAFSPDGERIVSASRDGTARVWRMDGSDQPLVLGRGRDWLWSAAFSPDGKQIVTASQDAQDGMAWVWQADGSGEPRALKGHTDAVLSAAFSPDGRRIVTASLDGTVRVWPASGPGDPLVLLRDDYPVRSAAFSPDSKRVVTASDNGMVRVWQADGSGKPRVLPGHQRGVRSAAFSPDGTRIVTASDDWTARVWRADGSDAGDPLVLEGHTDWVRSAAFSPDGTRIVTASDDGTARVWSADGSGEPLVLRGHSGLVYSAAFNPVDDKWIVTASEDWTVRIWQADADAYRGPRVLDGHTDWVRTAAFSPVDDKWIVTASDDFTARVWPADGSGDPLVLRGHTDWVRSAAFSPDGARIVTASDDGTARVWEVDGSDADDLVVLRHEGWVYSAVFSPDGTRIVTASDDGMARVWRADGAGEPLLLLRHEHWVYSAVFSPDGTRIVTASGDGIARVWDAATGQTIEEITGESGDVRVSLATFAGSSRTLALAYTDGRIVIRGLGPGNPRTLREAGTEVAQALQISGDGRFLATALDDGTVHLWEIETGHPILSLDSTADAVLSVALSSNAERVVTTSRNGTAQLWRVMFDRDKLIQEADRRLGERKQLTDQEKERFFITDAIGQTP